MRRPVFIIVVLSLFVIAAPMHILAMGSRGRGHNYNLLLVTIDTLRPDHLGCYGYQDVKTPVIDRLSSEGTLFTQVFTPVPITLPSHVSIMTGLYPVQHGIRNNGNFILGQEAITLAEVMKEQGYKTGACVGAFVLDSLFGLDQGFDHYDDSLTKEGAGATLLENERRAEAVTKAGLNWLKESGDCPFFLWLHYFDPHAIYLPPGPFDKEYKGHLYDGEIAYTDKCIGDLFDGLEEMGFMDRTVIILVSDHGEGLGEHGEPTHAIFLYDSTMRVPLIIRAPGKILPSGKKIGAMVSTLDIFPTVLDIFSIPLKKVPVSDLYGKSLIPLIMGKTDSLHQEILFESLYPELNFGWSRLEGIRTPGWKYIKAPKPELYNLAEDPKEEKNLCSENVVIWQERMERLKQSMGAGRDSRTALDDKIRERLESLGYVWSAKEQQTGGIGQRHDPKDMISLMECIDRGVSYIYLGFYEQAHKEFQGIIDINPENASALFYLASVEEKMGRLEDAEKTYRRLLEFSPDYLDVHNHLGVIYHRQGKLDLALREFNMAIEQAEYPEVYYNLSVVHRLMGNHDEAVRAAKKALSLDSMYADALNQLGQLALDSGVAKEASEYFLQALIIDPGHLEAHNNLGVVYHREGKNGEAIEEFNRALDIDPNRAEAHNNLGGVYLTIGNYDQAVESFRNAIRIKPDYVEAIINLGTVNFHKGEYSAARDHYLNAVELAKEDRDIWNHLGLLYLAQNEYDLAYEAFDKTIRSGHASADIYFYMGKAALGMRSFDNALNFWEKAIAADPGYKNAYIQKGQLLYDLGMAQEAIKEWKEAHRIDSEDPLPVNNMATVRFQNNEYSEAIALWEKALKLAPDIEDPYLHIGTAYLRLNDTEKAIQVWNQLLERRPDHIEALLNLGAAFYQRGNAVEAIKIWTKAEGLDTENAKIHYNLGLAFFSQGNYRQSLDELKEALRLDPDNQETLVLIQQAAGFESNQ
ncbi:tetratricopeptide repeat protein [bacterium]|nr:tetratricopeptide repeat protein [bacterium]